MKKVEIIEKRRLFDDFFKIDEAILRHQKPDGGMTPPLRRLSFERGDGVSALLHDPQRRTLILVRQFRYPAHAHGDGWLLETVAGMIDRDESPEETMCREILEETGYRVDALESIATFYTSPGGASERIFLYYAEVDDARRAHSGGGLDAEQEEIEVVELAVEEAWEQLDRNEIADAKTLIALMWLRRRLQREN